MQIFVKDPKNGQELNMIEMQGDLESRLGANVDVSGKFIGDLHYTKGTFLILASPDILGAAIIFFP